MHEWIVLLIQESLLIKTEFLSVLDQNLEGIGSYIVDNGLIKKGKTYTLTNYTNK